MQYFQRVNPLCNDVLIRENDINDNLLSIRSGLLESNTDSDVKSYYELESVANLLMDQKHAANEYLVDENENLLQVKTI